jgi:ABC-type uncharacterized transport system substrate-binding protein
MRRRDFITVLGGASMTWPLAARAQQPAMPVIALLSGVAVAWPLTGRAQQGDRTQRIGVLMGYASDSEAKAYLSGFTQGLSELGWTDGRNVRMDVRWAAGSVERMRMFAKELVDLQPDVILSHTTPVTAALQRETRTIPVAFVTVSDPVGDGFVVSLPRPGGNITGFIFTEAAIAGKWLALLTQIAPGVKCRPKDNSGHCLFGMLGAGCGHTGANHNHRKRSFSVASGT